MRRKHWKRAIAATLTSLAAAAAAAAGAPHLQGQTVESAVSVPAGLRDMTSSTAGPLQYLPFAHFNIPFEVEASGPLPREVHLWVSPDQGRSWLKYASTTPDKRSFEFHAAAEGEYLFAVQTRDSQGDSALTASPPMRILIDTTQPELQLAVDVSPAGRLVIDYQVSDAFLAEDAVQLACCPDGQGRWEDVRLGTLQRSGNSWSGRCEIDLPHCRELDVRITAIDRAQNKAERVAHFSAPRTAAANPGMQLASQRGDLRSNDPNSWTGASPNQPLHSAQRYPQTAASKPLGGALRPTQPAPTLREQPGLASSRKPAPGPAGMTGPAGVAGPVAAGAGLVASRDGIAWNPAETTNPRETSGWTVGPSNATARTVAAQPGMAASGHALDGTRVATAPPHAYEELPLPAAVEDSGADTSGSGLQLSDAPSLATGSSDARVGKQLPVTRRELAGIDLGTAAPTSHAAPGLDIGRSSEVSVSPPALAAQDSTERKSGDSSITTAPLAGSDDAYHSRSRTFSLDYAVDSLRGAAVADIELWGTEDRGRTWQKWGSDPDRQSPFDVQVGNDGSFGFRMVVIGANGLISNRPESGDAADMWINVDTQTPTVKITRALYGEGDQAGMLIVEFDGSDDNLHDRPITLSYSDRPGGPWVTIASGLPVTGKYVWKPDSSLPRQVFLRAQAVDRAGNTQEHRLELPVSLRGLTPQGRIQGFRPIDPK